MLAYERRHGDSRLLIALNFSGEPQPLDRVDDGRLLLSSYRDAEAGEPAPRVLRPDEGVVVRCVTGANDSLRRLTR